MAGTFDLDSALAGANSAAGLIDKVYYAPERHKMEMQRNDLAMRQGEAALDLTKLQTDNLRTETEKKKELEVSYGSQAYLEQMIELANNKDINKSIAGFSVLQNAGTASFAQKHKDKIPAMVSTLTKIRDAENSYAKILDGSATPEDTAAAKQAVALMYANTTTKNIKPEDIDVTIDSKTGKTAVTNKGVVLDIFNSPSDLAIMLHKDVSELEASVRAEEVFRTAHGDKATIDLLRTRRETLAELTELEKQAYTTYQKQQIALAYKAPPERRLKMIEALQKDIAEVSKSKEVAGLNAMIEKQFAPIDAKVAAAKGSKNKGALIADNLDSWAAEIAQSPQVQAAAAESGLDPLALSHKYLNDKFDKYLKLADVDVKEEHNRAIKEAARVKGTEVKTSSENLKLKLQSRNDELKAAIPVAYLDPKVRERMPKLREEIKKLEEQLDNAEYTPSGKRAERFTKTSRTAPGGDIDLGSLAALLQQNQKK